MAKVIKNNNLNKFSKKINPLMQPKLPRKKSSRKSYLLRRIIITNALSLLVIALTYLWMIFFLSSVSSFWDIFRGKDVYVDEDNIPPIAPFVATIPEATQSSSIDITGKAEPGVKVELYVDGSKIEETISSADGTFAFTGIPVGAFSQDIYTKAVDNAGNVSNQSSTYSIKQDEEPPEVEITNPDSSETIYKSTEHVYRITGTSEPEVSVLVNDQIAVVNPNGEFFKELRLEEGGNSIKIVVKDKALNETEKEVFINFQKID